MKAVIQRGRIRIKPVPAYSGGKLYVWLKEPLTEGSQPLVVADIEGNRKFYTLPCPLENINGITIK